MAKLEKLLDQAAPHLDAGETVLSAIEGSYEVERFGADSVRAGIFMATEKRVVFYAKKMTGYDLESFPYKGISSFERGKGMMGGTLKFHASGNSVSVKWIQSKNLDEFVTVVKQHMDEASRSPSPPPSEGRSGRSHGSVEQAGRTQRRRNPLRG